MPDLGGRLRCLRVEVLQGIWRDEAIPCKLVELKLQFLHVDVSRLVSRRYTAALILPVYLKHRQQQLISILLIPADASPTLALQCSLSTCACAWTGPAS